MFITRIGLCNRGDCILETGIFFCNRQRHLPFSSGDLFFFLVLLVPNRGLLVLNTFFSSSSLDYIAENAISTACTVLSVLH